jgi:pimeloyl-ACP methyl ester carboxylesterase
MGDAELDAYYGNLLTGGPGVREDLTRFLRQVSNRDTLEAARSFPGFRGPVLLVWGEGDPIFPARYARRLRDDFPDPAALRLELPRLRARGSTRSPGAVRGGVCRSEERERSLKVSR